MVKFLTKNMQGLKGKQFKVFELYETNFSAMIISDETGLYIYPEMSTFTQKVYFKNGPK